MAITYFEYTLNKLENKIFHAFQLLWLINKCDSQPLDRWASSCCLYNCQGTTPLIPKVNLTEGTQSTPAHSDGRLPQHRDPHTSPHAANWGLALQPRLLAPNPFSKSSTNLGSPSLSPEYWPYTHPLRPHLGLQHSLLHHMVLKLSQ